MLEADPTQADFNCYVSYVDAGSILSTRLNIDDWKAATETDQKRALITASAAIDLYVEWNGTATADDQNMDWPRSGVYIHDREGTFASDEIPDFLQVATCEYATELLKEDLLADQETGLDALTVGPISLQFSDVDRKSPMPDNIRLSLDRYGTVMTGKSNTVRLVRR